MIERAFEDSFFGVRGFNSKRTTYGKDLKALMLENLLQLKKGSVDRICNLSLKVSVSL